MRSIEIPQPEDRHGWYRFFEILPGALTWLILISPVVLSLINPKLAAYFIVAYLLLWFIRSIGWSLRSLQGWRRIKQYRRAPWQKMNQDLEALTPKTTDAPAWHFKNLQRVENYIPNRIKPSEVYHAIMIAFWHEPREILEPTVESVLASDYDPKKIILILAYEERGGPEVKKTALDLAQKYQKKFGYVEAIEHTVLPGEIPGKGANITHAGRRLQKILEAKKIDPLHVLVTTLDSDNRPDPQYLASLTYTYCSTEDPKRASYQPVPMFLNNIWDAPAPMRVIATGNSFWNVILSMRPHMLRNFASHAQPMAALIDTDFWSVRTIVEDGHQFWRTFFRYDGHHDVFPIYVPIYQDAVLTGSLRGTIKAQFYQIRRWAYGASDIAYFANQAFVKENKISKPVLVSKFLRLVENHISWSTAPLVVAIAALLPFFFNPQSYIANQLPQLASKLEQVALVGILVSLFLSFQALPPKPERYKRRRTFWMVVQWIYLPFTTIIFNAFAAINSQTHLMFGRYLGKFDSTEKAIKSERPDIKAM